MKYLKQFKISNYNISTVNYKKVEGGDVKAVKAASGSLSNSRRPSAVRKRAGQDGKVLSTIE